METKQPLLCKYFLHGACSKGSQCTFAHDLYAKADNVCKFYLLGSCMYGKSCRYDHVKPSKVIMPVPHIYQQEPPSHSRLIPLGKKDEIQMDVKEIELICESKDVEWYDAPVFLPGVKSHQTSTLKEEVVVVDCLYSEVASSNIEPLNTTDTDEEYDESGVSFEGNSRELLCPFAAIRECPYGDSCEYLHGDLCDMCGCLCLHPTDLQQRKEHENECLAHHEEEMEIAFAVQRSSGVSCSVCLDVVKDKTDLAERVFGILENCNHPFCLTCIRKWRLSSYMEKTVIRSCPICRVVSWFVTPSDFWVEDEEEKTKLINNYKGHLTTKYCRNFDRGRGVCPFGSSCFYKHVLEDGSMEESELNLRHIENSEGEASVVKTARLSEFIADRDTTM